MGSPYGSSVIFLPLDRNEVFFGYLVGIPSGWGHPFRVCISRSDLEWRNSYSWALGSSFPARPRGVFLSSFGRPVCSEAGRVPHSVVIASGGDSVCIPLANNGVGLGPSSSGPVASRPGGSVCFGSLAVILFTWAFHAMVFHAWWLASGTSGCRTSR